MSPARLRAVTGRAASRSTDRSDGWGDYYAVCKFCMLELVSVTKRHTVPGTGFAGTNPPSPLKSGALAIRRDPVCFGTKVACPPLQRSPRRDIGLSRRGVPGPGRRNERPKGPAALRKLAAWGRATGSALGGTTMSEFVVLVESITGAGWLFLCGLVVVAVGFLTLDRPRPKLTKVEGAAKPGAQRAA